MGLPTKIEKESTSVIFIWILSQGSWGAKEQSIIYSIDRDSLDPCTFFFPGNHMKVICHHLFLSKNSGIISKYSLIQVLTWSNVLYLSEIILCKYWSISDQNMWPEFQQTENNHSVQRTKLNKWCQVNSVKLCSFYIEKQAVVQAT